MSLGRLGKERNSKKEAQKRERELAKRLGGVATPNSGAVDGHKGDVVLDNYLIDDKFTDSPSYTLRKADLDKITREARERAREPLFFIYYRKEKGIAEWVLIPKRICSEPIFEAQQVENKTILLSSKSLNSMGTRALKEDKEPILELEFFKRTLGVDSTWLLVPLQYLEKRGYFE